jgi:RimJ/RimL family protein N-acetyltransferase
MLQTSRLILRNLTAADFAPVHAYACNPLVTRYTSFGPNSEDETRAFIARSIESNASVPRRSHAFGVIDRGSNTLFGGCGLEACDDTGKHFSFGYVLHQDWWGKGFGKEAAGALVRFAFETLEAHRLWAYVFLENVASARILTSLGFRCEGVALESQYLRGRWHDIKTFARLRSEWLGSE